MCLIPGKKWPHYWFVYLKYFFILSISLIINENITCKPFTAFWWQQPHLCDHVSSLPQQVIWNASLRDAAWIFSKQWQNCLPTCLSKSIPKVESLHPHLPPLPISMYTQTHKKQMPLCFSGKEWQITCVAKSGPTVTSTFLSWFWVSGICTVTVYKAFKTSHYGKDTRSSKKHRHTNMPRG